jgi:hypothetical protein
MTSNEENEEREGRGEMVTITFVQTQDPLDV